MNYNVSLQEMKLFLMTTRFCSFSEVARREDMTPSSVSRKMAQLEQKVGAKLLHRHTRALSLTEEGQAFARQCADILQQYERTVGQIEQRADTPRGTIRISAPVAFGRRHIAPYLAELLERYPLLRVELLQTDTFIDPAAESIDLLIRIGVSQDSSLKMKTFGQQRFLMAASPDYLHRHGEPATPGDLTQHNCLVFKGRHGLQRWFIGRDRPQPYDVSGTLYSNNADSLVQSAVDGAGLVVFPSWLIGDALKSGQLRPVMTDYAVSTSIEQQAIAALYLETDRLATKVRVVIDFLAQKYGSPCYWDTV